MNARANMGIRKYERSTKTIIFDQGVRKYVMVTAIMTFEQVYIHNHNYNWPTFYGWDYKSDHPGFG